MTTDTIDVQKINVNPTGKGTFGFTNFAEIWNGRMAMIGFAAALVNEIITGKGILGQVGVTSKGGDIFVVLILLGFSAAALLGYYAVKINKAPNVPTPPSQG